MKIIRKIGLTVAFWLICLFVSGLGFQYAQDRFLSGGATAEGYAIIVLLFRTASVLAAVFVAYKISSNQVDGCLRVNCILAAVWLLYNAFSGYADLYRYKDYIQSDALVLLTLSDLVPGIISAVFAWKFRDKKVEQEEKSEENPGSEK